MRSYCLELLRSAAPARPSLSVHCISSYTEWSRLARQVLGQKVKLFVFVFFKCMIFKEVNFIIIVMFLQKVLLSQTFGNIFILWNSWISGPGVTI